MSYKQLPKSVNGMWTWERKIHVCTSDTDTQANGGGQPLRSHAPLHRHADISTPGAG